MAQRPPIDKPWHLVIPGGLHARLHAHLFPGDEDEHGAVILAGLAETDRDVRLLARELHLARDGQDYVPGKRGYRMLRAEFVTELVLRARDDGLIYLAIHNHPGTDRVSFSNDDLRSHERGYPALLDITRGGPVGALVFAESAVAGDIWLSGQRRVTLAGVTVVAGRRQRLVSAPLPRPPRSDPRYDRQARLFGDRGQDVLGNTRVAVVGLGGVGSLIVEFLARLGVGHFVVVDPDRAALTNLSRLIGATRHDAGFPLGDSAPRWLRALGRMLTRRKVDLARRNIGRANPNATVEALATDFTEPNVTERLKDCDYIFLAADTMRARLLFNALVHQYLIPGTQVGAKIVVDKATGAVRDVYAVVRPVTPESGCLWCNRFINPAKLQEESLSERERHAQAYVDEPAVVAPSVMALNALASSQAANDFMFYTTGLAGENLTSDYMYFRPSNRAVSWDRPRADPACTECGRSAGSRFARGDGKRLPARSRSLARRALR